MRHGHAAILLEPAGKRGADRGDSRWLQVRALAHARDRSGALGVALKLSSDGRDELSSQMGLLHGATISPKPLSGAGNSTKKRGREGRSQ